MAGIPKVKGAHSVAAQPITLQVPPPEVEQTPVAGPPVVIPADLPAQALQIAMDALGITPDQLQAMAAGAPLTIDVPTDPDHGPGADYRAASDAMEVVNTVIAEMPPGRTDPTIEQRLEVAADMAADGDLALAVQQLTAVTAQLVEAVRTIGTQQQWMTDRMVGMGEMFATAAPIIGGGGNPLTMFKKLATAMAAAGGRKEIDGG